MKLSFSGATYLPSALGFTFMRFFFILLIRMKALADIFSYVY